MKNILRTHSVAFVLACCLMGQSTPERSSGTGSDASIRDPLPKPGCNAYVLQTVPLDGFHWKQRTCYWSGQLFTGNALFGAAFFAGIAQATHTPSEWPQGAHGFGRRFGTRYLQGMVKTSTDFLVGGITREDPRLHPPQIARIYHPDRRGCRPPTTVKGRLGQALLRPVWDTCESHPAYGRIAGSFASGFIQLLWLPNSQNHVSTALKGTASAMGGYYGASITGEFAGDLIGWFGRKVAGDKP